MIGLALLVCGRCAVSLVHLSLGWLCPEETIASGIRFFGVLRSLGGVGMLVFAPEQIAVAVTGLLPAALLGVVAGAVYGLMMGFFIAAVSTMLAAMLALGIARSVPRSFVERMLAFIGLTILAN